MISSEQLQNWSTARKDLVAQWGNFYQEHQNTVHTVAIVTLAGATGMAIGLWVGKGILVAKGVTVATTGATQSATTFAPVTTAATVKGAVTLLGNTAVQGASLLDKAVALFNTLSANAIPLTAGAVGGGAAGVGVTRYQVRQVKEQLNAQVAQTAAMQSEAVRIQQELRNTEANLAEVQTKLAPQVVPDDLEAIYGIGRVIAQRLNAAGIYTFAELAAQTPQQLRTLVGSGRAATTMNPEAWIAEARQRVASQAAPATPGVDASSSTAAEEGNAIP